MIPQQDYAANGMVYIPEFIEKDEQIREKAEQKSEEVEKENLQPNLQNKFDFHLRNYLIVIQHASRYGARIQGHLDSAYEVLADFAEEHPEFRPQVPKRTLIHDSTNRVARRLAIRHALQFEDQVG